MMLSNVTSKIRIRSLGFMFAVLIIGSVGCEQNTDIPEDLVAQVNDQFLLKEQLQYSVPEGLDDKMALALQKNLITQWVENEIFYQTAVKEGVAYTSAEKYMIDQYMKALLVQRYLDQRLNKNYKISQKEMDDYYRDHSKELVRKEDEVHLIHLLLEQKDNAIFKEIGESSNLMSLIKKYYFDEKSTSERPNGDLGYVPVSDLPDEFVKVISRMRTGAISNPIRTDQGYHFFQLVDFQKKGSTIDLELVKNEIMMRIKKERRGEELERLKKELKENFQVQTYLSKIQ
ncbi:MAG: peptidyl-prolyl cis-trans isomerase [Calditrichaceae bacterium]